MAKTPHSRRAGCLRYFRWLAWAVAIAVLGAFIFLRWRMHGPDREYRVDIIFDSLAGGRAADAPLFVGAARRDITPDLTQFDPWTDADGDSQFKPEKGDTYEDRNKNGDFDFVWLGGFHSNRPAQGINDPLWTRALALRHHDVTLVIVSIDCVGLTHERFINLRQSIDHQKFGITHILGSSTHTHNSPDTMGIWSHRPVFGRFDEGYVARVLDLTREAVLEAVASLERADAVIAGDQLEPQGYVRDSRQPLVYDRQLTAARFVKAGSQHTIAILVSWGNHPEAMGGKNPLISSDFAHYWRSGVESGVPDPQGAPGLGGICIYVQGPVGGLMTPLGLDVPDKDGQTVHRENGVGKTRALGENLALHTLRLLQSSQASTMTQHAIRGVAQTIFVPIDGPYRYPIMLGLIHPGWYDGKARTEVSAVQVGDLEILAIPGEVYPEIVDGGVESPDGADFPGPPVEVPPLRSLMRGKVNMVFNLANDEIGYIIPRTQWDTRPPHTYGSQKPPYGEENSGGSEAGLTIHRECLNVLRRLHDLTPRMPDAPADPQ